MFTMWFPKWNLQEDLRGTSLFIYCNIYQLFDPVDAIHPPSPTNSLFGGFTGFFYLPVKKDVVSDSFIKKRFPKTKKHFNNILTLGLMEKYC